METIMRTMLFTTVAALPLLLATPAPAQAPAPLPETGAQPAPTAPGTPQKPAVRQQQMPQGATSPSGTRPQTGEAAPAPGEAAPTPKSGKAAQEQTTPRKKSTADSGPTGGIGALSAEKRTTVRQSFAKHHATPVTNITFNVGVGVAVPRTIELQVLPREVVEIVPQYRGYRYFVLADGRIIIVDPSTYEIVFILA
jgi:hypothetical protein